MRIQWRKFQGTRIIGKNLSLYFYCLCQIRKESYFLHFVARLSPSAVTKLLFVVSGKKILSLKPFCHLAIVYNLLMIATIGGTIGGGTMECKI